MTFDLTDGRLNPPSQGCSTFLLWAEVKWRDPNFPLTVCEIGSHEKDQNPQVVERSARLGVTIQTTNMAADQSSGRSPEVSWEVNNWLLMAGQAGVAAQSDCVVCLGPRPMLKVVPPPPELTPECIIDLMANTELKNNCAKWDLVYPLTRESIKQPTFDKNVAKQNFTCFHQADGPNIGSVEGSLCASNFSLSAWLHRTRSDIWWWCGNGTLKNKLPSRFTGTCAIVTLLLPVTVVKAKAEILESADGVTLPQSNARRKRSLSRLHWEDDPTYIDAIGVPRGVPDQYKLANQIAAGFENLPIIGALFPITTNKNVDRINYIHYNVQRLGNYTLAGFRAVHEQLAATSLMAFQNRIALDMLLAEKGGVCGMFGEQCSTFIPNNTAPDGRLTTAIQGLKTLNEKMKEHSGVDTSMWDGWLDPFGRFKGLIASALMSIAVFAAVLTLCGCCCIPCIRALITKLVNAAIGKVDNLK